jgi:hypothetical protein
VFSKKKTPSTKGGDGSNKLLAFGFAFAGTVALVLTCAQNAMFGVSLGDTNPGVIIQGATSISMDVFTGLLAIGVGTSIVLRRWVALVLTLIPMALYLGYSMQSSVNYGMTERLAKAERVQGVINAEKGAIDAANAATLASQQDTLRDLRRRYDNADSRANNRELSKSERREARAEKSRLDDAIRVAQIAPTLQIAQSSGKLADPAAQITSRWTGLDAETISLMQVVAQGVGLVLMKFVGFAFAGYWGQPRKVAAAAKIEAETTPQNTTDPVKEEAVSAPASSLSPPVAAAPEETAVEEDIAPEVLKPVALEARRMLDDRDIQKADLVKFFETATHPASQSLVGSADFYNHYKEWSKANGRKAVVKSHTMFGILIQELGAKRSDNGNRVFYQGFNLISPWADGVQEVPLLAAA